jgi:uncharacterized membrane protein
MKKFGIIFAAFVFFVIWNWGAVFFDVIDSGERTSERAVVLEILSDREERLPVLETLIRIQEIKALLLLENKEVFIKNDQVPLSIEDRIYLKNDLSGGGDDYSIHSVDRRVGLTLLFGFFVFFILYFSGWTGIKSLLSLLLGVLLIAKVFIPSILGGFDPVFVSVFVASFILFLAIFMAHGFNRGSCVAFGGTFISVILTGFLAYLSVSFLKLSGISSDEAVYLNFNTLGNLDLSGLLLGGIIIGALGVLDDVAVTQVSLVKQFILSNKGFISSDIYKMAMNVGRDHIGAMINTIALAYLGSSLALVLFLYTSEMSWLEIINHEAVVTEITRTIVGSIGLILSVPITTYLAVRFIK